MQCPTCPDGVLIVVRWWLEREIRQCDHCQTRFAVSSTFVHTKRDNPKKRTKKNV